MNARRALVTALAVACLTARMAGGQPPSPTDGGASRFAEIPAGPFTMGAGRSVTAEAFDNERWSASAEDGRVDLPAFYLARHEVTIAEYSAFVQATGWTVDQRALAGQSQAPVAFVSWPDALAYCRWLTATLASASNTTAALTERLRAGWRATLPTEAQWEKAARGPDRRVYPWGDQPRADRAQFATQTAALVGAHPCPECPYGLEDMAGNVWEWTRSPNQPYPYDDSDDRAGLEAEALWVIRGGGFADPARLIRTTVRGAAEPGARRAFIGFRVAIVPPAPRR